jgi:arylsulfatase A-like enzyme
MPRPNFLLFMPDQLRADAVGCYGNPAASTPSLDALAARGVRCTDAWSQHSVCGPSRVSIMTSWYPHVSGHRTLDNLLKPWEPNLCALLKEAGYTVAIAGNRGDVFAPGVTEQSSDFCGWIRPPSPEAIGRRYTPAYPEGHRLFRAMYFGSGGDELLFDGDEATIQTAETWLEEGAPGDRPWALWVPLLFPHPPFTVEEPWFSMHDRADMPEPVPVPASGKPEFMAAYREVYGWGDLTTDDLREVKATYYGMVSRVDDQLGRLVSVLERTGAFEQTVVVVFTDHGEYLGDFGLVEKWPSGLDRCLLQNPLVFAGGGLPEGVTFDQPVEMVDLMPTLCAMGEAEVRHTHFGRSLLTALERPSDTHRAFACAEGGFRVSDRDLLETAGWIYEPKAALQRTRPELVGTAMVVRTPEHTYVHRRYESDELYDRRNDPSETVNLIDRAETNELAASLRDTLFGWLADTSDVIPWNADPRFPEIPQGWRSGDDEEAGTV